MTYSILLSEAIVRFVGCVLERLGKVVLALKLWSFESGAGMNSPGEVEYRSMQLSNGD